MCSVQGNVLDSSCAGNSVDRGVGTALSGFTLFGLLTWDFEGTLGMAS